jgi:arylsulfatase A-like enzyme
VSYPKLHLVLSAASVFFLGSGDSSRAEQHQRPNIILILADDLGYADLGCQGSGDVSTPHIDSVAANGVRCTDGYVTAPQCAPARAALITGRYQNRFGFESNEQGYSPGIPVEEKVISERLQEAGYATAVMGKWGVGNRKPLHPPQRGFDHSYWLHDGNLYFPESEPGKNHDTRVRRGNQQVEQPAYSTDAFAEEAVKFIERQKGNPYFLYLPFITPHEPMEAKPEDLARFPDVEDPLRKTFLAMMANLDDNVGRILDAVRQSGRENDTLLFFLSDNGGYAGNASRNDPFSGTKSQMLEGGIRVPFIIQWKGVLPAGEVYRQPVSSLDVAATAYAAAGLAVSPEWELDGTDLIPYLTGQKRGSPHEALYWRFNFPLAQPNQHGWAVRQGDWKLVRNGWAQTAPALYDLAADPGETNDLSRAEPEKVRQLKELWERWNKENIGPAES